MALTKADLDAAHTRIVDEVGQEFERLASLITPPPPPPAVHVKFANHRYWGSGPYPAADFYDLQEGSWDRAKIPATAEIYREVTTARNAEPLGLRQFLPPARVPDAWLAHHRDTGSAVWRSANSPEGDYLLNVGNPELIAAIVGNLDNITQRYHGLYLDEIDNQMWGYGGALPREFATVPEWQAAHLKLVQAVAAELHRLGRKLWINLGADYDISDPWQRALVDAVDGINIEHFVSRAAVSMAPATGIAWHQAVKFTNDAEKLGKQVHAHASGVYQPYIDYAFVSWLAGTEFLGSFSASLNYSGELYMPTQTLVDAAKRLGPPLESYVKHADGSVTRSFTNGGLIVNPTSTDLGDLPHLTGGIFG